MQAKLESAIRVDISVYLEGIHSMLLIQGKAVNLTFVRSLIGT